MKKECEGSKVMAEYLNREAIMKFSIRKDHCDPEHANEHFINGIESVLEYVENLPPADVAPVVHGRWVTHYRSGTPVPEGYVSTCCDMWNSRKRNYCPNCGAKMDGGEDR